MSTVPRLKRILFLALPIIGGMVSQNILNLVDTGMVGALGDQALAAVGLGGIANFLATAFVLGMGAGVQAICARRVGEGKLNESAVPLNGGLLLAVSVSIPWAILLWFLVPFVFPYFIDDSAVVDQGIPYLQARVLAMTAMAMNVCFRGFWNATDRSWLYMSTLIVMHVTNIFLNWVLIYGNLGAPRLGAEGAGVASAIATWLGTVVYVGLAVHFARGQGFLARRPSGAVLRSILKLSIPNGIQQTFFAGGMFTFHLIVGQMGTAQLAASNVIVNLLLVGILPGIGFGLAGMSLVGQALGRGEPEDARRWGWDVAKVALVVVALIALPGMLFPELMLTPFLKEESTRALGSFPLRLVCITLPLDAVSMVLLNALLGAGENTKVMFASVGLQWGLFLPAAFVVGPILGFGLTAVWIANIVYRQIQLGLFGVWWQGDGWTRVQV